MSYQTILENIPNLFFVERAIFSNLQKQPPRGVPRKRCSENMQQIYRRPPVPKCDFNKRCVKSVQITSFFWSVFWSLFTQWKLQSNFIEITLGHGCPPVNLPHFFRTPFLIITSGWLLLNLLWFSGKQSLRELTEIFAHKSLESIFILLAKITESL